MLNGCIIPLWTDLGSSPLMLLLTHSVLGTDLCASHDGCHDDVINWLSGRQEYEVDPRHTASQ